MDTVSPLIYKKLDFNKFSNVYTYCNNDNFDNSNHSYMKQSKITYDEYSGKFIQLNDDNIKIFNKKVTNLHKNFDLKLTIKRVNLVTVDKLLRYLLIVIDGQTILIVNLRKSIVCDILQTDCSNLKGIFFLSNDLLFLKSDNNVKKNVISNNNSYNTNNCYEIYFCLVFYKKIVYYKISANNLEESMSEFKSVKLSYIISDYAYDPLFNVLMLHRQDEKNKFELYNLNNKKIIGKSFSYVYPLANNNRKISSNSNKNTDKLFGKSSKSNFKIINYENQFFLKSIYFKLMIVSLNFEEMQIQVSHVITLQNIKRIWNYNLNISNICTLQFIDNIIVYHDFVNCQSLLIDIKNEDPSKPLFPPFQISNKDVVDENERRSLELIDTSIIYNELGHTDFSISYNFVEYIPMNSKKNKEFYNMKLNIVGSIVHDIEKENFYILYFDSNIYMQQTNKEFYSIIDIMRRQNSKEVVLSSIYNLIKEKRPIKAIKIVFSKIVNEYKLSLSANNSLISNLSGVVSNDYEIYNLESFMLMKKILIKPTDLSLSVFKIMIYDSKVDKIYLIEVILFFINCLIKEKILVDNSYSTLLVKLFNYVYNNNKICCNYEFSGHLNNLNNVDTSINNIYNNKYFIVPMLLQYQALPDNLEIAKFLIDEGNNNEGLFQNGLDMLKRLGKNEVVVTELLKKNLIEEALLYLKQNKITLKNISEDLINKLKELIKTKRNVIIDFVKS